MKLKTKESRSIEGGIAYHAWKLMDFLLLDKHHLKDIKCYVNKEREQGDAPVDSQMGATVLPGATDPSPVCTETDDEHEAVQLEPDCTVDADIPDEHETPQLELDFIKVQTV